MSKFTVGDRVRVGPSGYGEYVPPGTYGVVTEVDAGFTYPIRVRVENGKLSDRPIMFREDELVPFGQSQPPAPTMTVSATVLDGEPIYVVKDKGGHEIAHGSLPDIEAAFKAIDAFREKVAAGLDS